MNDKLKKAFDQVQAEETLKNHTKAFLYQKTNGYAQKKPATYRHLVSAFACIAIILFCGHWLYFTPTVEISIDINPSMELGVNRFNRIISVEGYNDDGKAFVDSLDIKFMNYSDAVNQIIESEDIASLLSNDEIMTIAVVGADQSQSAEVLSHIQSSTDGKSNTFCYYAPSEDVEKAHDVGLSYGKYRAFLEMQELDPNVTVADIQNMTMRQIRDFIDKCTKDGEHDATHSGNGKNEGNKGNGSPQGEKKRRGKPTDESQGKSRG